MPFAYQRTLHLADTDAAGVVYFVRTISLCHEAYEEALAAAGVRLADLLGANGIVVPIAKCEAQYLRPLHAGDKVRVVVTPVALTEDSFAVDYEVHRLGSPEKLMARVRTEHVCTSPAKRARAVLPGDLAAWVAAR
ncbi:thioesterase family protein [Opitutus sp. ER46]|uniref:acyl-CoA thioesterase n=1 Tax=Opitutus sp. ER46 TaxID=2161864 RepID=UPI000D30DAE7|nr:thioesterase family protein [Opitutus sp. ER46]PTX94577.1 acyl-CoA thioesterase [Opitutus sp. ER46]